MTVPGISVGGHIDGHGARLAGRAALVSGAGSAGDLLGTGAATAVLFAAQGALTGVMDISRERAETTCAIIANDGGAAVPVIADITDEAAVTEAVDAFARHAGRLDVVVNNTGITAGPWDRVFAVNVTGAMLTSNAVRPHLIRSGGGSIINISSIAGVRGFGSGAYGASKGAVQAMTTDLAFAWGRDGIRVNCLLPGHLYTPMGDQGGAEGRELRRRANLLGTEGTAWDLAWAALFLAGPESRWITAATLPVDAGTISTTGLAMLSRLAEPIAPG